MMVPHVSMLAMATCLLALLGVVAGVSPVYDRSHQITPGFTLDWKVSGEWINIKLETDTNAGWMGFGIGEMGSGSMPGADIVVCSFESDGVTPWVSDRYALDFVKPKEDTSQDWVIVSGTRLTSGGMSCELRRKLDTGDSAQDRAIKDDGMMTRVLFAHSTSGYVPNGDFAYHTPANRYLSQINFFNSDDPVQQLLNHPHYGGSADFLNDAYTIPASGTTYYKHCFPESTNSLAGLNTSIIGVEPVYHGATKAHVHHLVLFAHSSPDCSDYNAKQIYASTPGQLALVYPANSGVDTKNFRSYQVEFHYDNPEQLSGKVDSSGVRMYYTTEDTLMPTKLGYMVFGDPAVSTQAHQGTTHVAEQVPMGYSRYDFTCPSSVTADWPHDINIIADFLHMHEVGVSIEMTVKRGGAVVKTRRIQYYQFEMQNTVGDSEPYVIKRGDEVTVTCYFHTDASTGTRVFGLGSRDEMCMNFAVYYPAFGPTVGHYAGCATNYKGRFDWNTNNDYRGTWSKQTLAGEENLPRSFGQASSASSSGGGGSSSTVIIAAAAGSALVAVVIGAILYKRHNNRSRSNPDKSRATAF